MLVLGVTVFGVVAVAGAPKRWLAGLGLSAVSAAFAAVALGLLHGYQLDRFAAFLDPAHDPRGAGYNTTQARIAIGNGGIFGQGLFHGSQTQSGFVPEQHTDFVFTVVGEELGLVGGATVLGLFGLLAWRIWRAAWLTADPFGALCCAGVLAMLVFQVTENVGMTMGITPITGIPLPFLSYGGSSMVASFAAVGLAANVARTCPKDTGAAPLPAARLATT
jgi:rod shape determining protein RodA